MSDDTATGSLFPAAESTQWLCGKPLRGPLQTWTKCGRPAGHSGPHQAKGATNISEDSVDLGGWSVSICPGCGAQVNEWLTTDGPDVIEHERCPMCDEADIDAEGWS